LSRPKRLDGLMRRGDGERGVAATELTLAMPVVLILIMLVFQAGLYYHAANVATAAAQDGLRAAQVAEGSPGAGDQRAREILGRSAGRLLDDVDVTVSPDARRVRVQVSGSVASVVPGLNLRVTRTAEGPREQFLPPDQR
jgi:hypothetical protein